MTVRIFFGMPIEMAMAVASMLFDPIRAPGLKNEIEVMSHSKTKPFTLARLGEVPKGFAAFGRGFVGIDDSRQPSHESIRGVPLR